MASVIATKIAPATGCAALPRPRAMVRFAGAVRCTAWLLGAALTCGCSLLSIKSPEIPLSAREQEARLLTREYAAHFASVITHLPDAPPAGASGATLRTRLLRFKLSAVTEITRASTGLSPIASLLDTWAFALQLRDYLQGGAGAGLFDGMQAEVRLAATGLADDADALAHKVAEEDYSRYRSFVLDYAQRHPLENADFVRPSVLSAWSSEQSDKRPLRTVGTVAQALGDVSDRMRIYGERVPDLGVWQAELALDRAGFDDATYRNALHDMQAQLERISKLADASPDLAREAIGEFRASLRETSDRLDAAGLQMLRALHVEREALAANVAAERASATVAFDAERIRVSQDAAQIAARAVDTSWRELRRLIREALLLIMLLAVLVLGMPFAAGYLVGRRRAHGAGVVTDR